jgi:carbamoyltransferase
MLVLGWHGGWTGEVDGDPPRSAGGDVLGHDGAAVLIRDGTIVAAIEEERLSRVKHSRAFPARSIRFCLDEAGAKLSDVDAIVTDTSEPFLDAWVFRRGVEEPGRMAAGGLQWIAELFRREFNEDVGPKLKFCRHHLAHLYASYYASGFDAALGVCFDGAGDGPSGLIAECGDGGVKPLRQIPIEQSLGYFYTRSIALLGYRLFDEYKVMGLAPYGNAAVYRSVFSRMYELEAEGRFTVVTEAERQALLEEARLTKAVRPKGDAFTQQHRDIAAALQEALERIAEHTVTHAQRVTGARKLCLGGGVAHNCSMNGRLLRSGRFDDIYVQPAAHDAGNALGAALSVLPMESRRRGFMPHVYFGTRTGGDAVAAERLRRWAPLISMRQVDDPSQAAAALIADGLVIGWVQGKSEFGPRALGNRSILADPRPAENKSIINGMVKKREGYRPFAPSVLQERLHDFFDVPAQVTALPFMTMVVPVKAEKRELLGAVTHVDGTARVQTVSAADNPRYYALIEAFGAATGVPIVLNTSFNNHAEPIVDSVDDAVVCFLTTGIHRLVVENWVVEKVADVARAPALQGLCVSLSSNKRLISRQVGGCVQHHIESDGSAPFAGRAAPVSAGVHTVLQASNLGSSLAEVCTAYSLDPHAIALELYELWQNRLIILSPPDVSAASAASEVKRA